MLNVIRYVALNSVRAGIVERPEQYRWGSYRAHAGYEAAPPWLASNQLLEHQAPDRRIAQGLYRTFVDEKIGDKHRIWDDLVGQIYLGSQRWIETMRECANAWSPGRAATIIPARSARSAGRRCPRSSPPWRRRSRPPKSDP